MRLNWRKNCSGLLIIGYWLFLSGMPAAHGQTALLDLNSQIQNKKKAQQELQQRITQYSERIRTTQRQAASLSNQINILEANINKAELEIKTKELEAEQLALESELVERQINDEEDRLTRAALDIGALLREVQRFDDRKYIDVVLAERSFSEIFDQLFYSEKVIQTLRNKITVIQAIRATLQKNKEMLLTQKEEAQQRQENLAILQVSFEQEKRVKEALFGKTKSTEQEFRSLLSELRGAAAAIDSDLVTLERKIRERLDLADKLAGQTGLFSWPVPPIGGITASFHDQDYPFRYLFEHSGIDIRTPQGTPVRAGASGYVAKAFNSGYGIQPSYVLLVHGNSLATVYMHLSSITVRPDTFLARGDIIGYSGGTPRTSGAGRWSTGPHLHFEVRLNSTPVNPVGYLP